MKLYYYDRHANFGDGMNQWLWQRVLPGCWDSDDGIAFAGIGTIIGPEMPPARQWIVCTSGIGYGGVPRGFGDAGWSIVAVRGPLSAAALGLQRDSAITDGAILLATLPEYAPLAAHERHGVIFIPHHQSDDDADWREVCRRAGVEYLTATVDSREAISRIRGAKLILAEAMHGAIVADTMRVPWVPIVGSPQINSFKWLDWTRSMEVTYAPIGLPAANVVAALRHRLLWAYRESYQFEAADEDAALAYFRQRFGSKPSRLRVVTRRVVRRQHGRLTEFLQSPWAADRLCIRDERMMDRAAAVLAKASQGPGVLSDDRIFGSRLDQLASRLDAVRQLVS